MICQNCHQNPATIHLSTSINGRQTSIDLCQSCYRAMKERAQGNNLQDSTQDPFGFGSLNDIFRSMGNEAPNNPQYQNRAENQQQFAGNGGRGNRGGGILAQYGLDLTAEAKNNKIDPVIGRDKEIARVTEILNRRTKNNPVLIGEAGVGKTAVVEGLAQKIVNGDVPQKLLNKRVIRLDVVSLVQGTGIRGQFEQRMQQLMTELKQNQDIILFIDEIHEIVGAGNAEGGMDAGNVLKPALARGELQLVGATTMNEYRAIEKDAALARRLQPVQVNEPTTAETIAILKGIQKKYEAYHHVRYTPQAIKAAVELSNRYIQDRFLPDKAIDLLDESGSRKNLTIQAVDPQVIEEKIKKAEEQKKDALQKEDYEKAAYYRDQENKFSQLKNSKIETEDTPEITEKDMEKIIEEKTNIPVGELQQKEQQQLKDLASSLEKHVIGQNEAVDKVARAIRRNRIGFNKSGRPIGSFLFVGPTGVGKTETARQLAKELFGTEDSMIRFDMSEYMEKHSVSKLIGSPPGYVGYEEAGQLTEQVRRHPYSLVLLDEIEKAHPDVMHMFLQILDDGRLTDSQGRTVSFKDTIIIMTSNAGSGDSVANVGFGAAASGQTHSVLDTLSKYFKPEFLNRFDDIVEFNPLSKKDLLSIVSLMLHDVRAMLAHQNLTLSITDAAKEKLVDLGYDPKMGARPLRRVIQEQIEDNIADYYLEHPEIKNFEAQLDDGQIKITTAAVINSANNNLK
ncbi:ATP-dependent Clp protease ATP-binding subunit [Liquorilactobacillus satsumensis]|uniref:ATP-dependent Clp protease ATP-binding subunit n=1 Tax=Liquorilactobacillus satsumensis TaxID=259059 RepID=UPI001E48DBCD|nr:ATP-dependent Clp protease ATP-binding subunit [Liquorilactobacillus satsumensis]MCC7666497.1 ATP-dependent Clp protease ATP-binding subunit [Liquorilactobacillus satsumensis]MCP9312908.1 AAA family ATPase [Liquorilactobacillus satsumensis]MCP9357537.1 AAA family ATPase [Liquorilactobacillus satsumensis]MCP9360058.1 AAA family ATPase [Liquorilactobacillus satsumensis]MCP9371365.1 AAA family ATPase [Liquorilactobacillus satsumensis]